MTESPRPSWRSSLRRLLVVVVLLALACVALEFASPLLTGVVAAVALMVCAVMAVHAFVDRGRRQAFAIGFTVVAAGFIYALHTHGDSSSEHAMPTTQLLQWLHGRMATRWMVDISTGEKVRRCQPSDATTSSLPPGYDVYSSRLPLPDLMADSSSRSSPISLPFGTPSGPLVPSDFPTRTDFIAVGNSLWTLLLAYLGGKLGAWVYARRVACEGNINGGTPA